jgi:hypothetical protein
MTNCPGEPLWYLITWPGCEELRHNARKTCRLEHFVSKSESNQIEGEEEEKKKKKKYKEPKKLDTGLGVGVNA